MTQSFSRKHCSKNRCYNSNSCSCYALVVRVNYFQAVFCPKDRAVFLHLVEDLADPRSGKPLRLGYLGGLNARLLAHQKLDLGLPLLYGLANAAFFGRDTRIFRQGSEDGVNPVTAKAEQQFLDLLGLNDERPEFFETTVECLLDHFHEFLARIGFVLIDCFTDSPQGIVVAHTTTVASTGALKLKDGLSEWR